jgi:hypothetical protein
MADLPRDPRPGSVSSSRSAAVQRTHLCTGTIDMGSQADGAVSWLPDRRSPRPSRRCPWPSTGSAPR